MSVIKLTLPPGEIPVNGKQVTFAAPCSCAETEAIQIDGVNYTVVDCLKNCVTGSGGTWAEGAVVSVVLDVDNKLAFIQGGGGGGGNEPAISEITVQPSENYVTLDVYLEGGGRDRIVIKQDASGNPSSITVNNGTPIPVTWGSWSGGDSGESGGSGKTYYNGVELPPLPTWDKSTYPCAVIVHNSAANGVLVYGSEYVLACGTRVGWNNGNIYLYGKGVLYNANGPEWVLKSNDTSGTVMVINSANYNEVIWSNTEIPNADGSGVFLPASEPTTGVG